MTTPAVVAFFEAHPDESFTAKELAEQAGLNLGTVSGWFIKKMDQTQIVYDVVEGTRKYRLDPNKVISDTPSYTNGHKPRKNQRMVDKARKQQASMRRKPGEVYAKLVNDDGITVMLVTAEGRYIFGRYVV